MCHFDEQIFSGFAKEYCFVCFEFLNSGNRDLTSNCRGADVREQYLTGCSKKQLTASSGQY